MSYSMTQHNGMARAGKKALVLEQHFRAGGFMHTLDELDGEFDNGINFVRAMDSRNSSCGSSRRSWSSRTRWITPSTTSTIASPSTAAIAPRRTLTAPIHSSSCSVWAANRDSSGSKRIVVTRLSERMVVGAAAPRSDVLRGFIKYR